MKILITGGSGFLGRHLRRHLKGEIIAPSSKTCDLTKIESLSQFNSFKFDQIFHLAAWTQAGDFCLSHPGEQWILNQQINTNVLAWWKASQPQAKLICMGTSCSYDPELPLSEEHYLRGKPIDSLFTYAMTKRMLLTGLEAFHKQFGLNYLYLIPSTLYGPSYHTDERQLHFIFDLIRKILRGKHYGESVVLWGDGEQRRELVHVDDFIQTMLHLNTCTQNTWINIGAGREHTIKEFAQLICTQVGFPLEKIEFDLSRYVGARSKVLSVRKLHSLFPEFKPKPLALGLQETVTWFENQFFQSEQSKVQNESKYMCAIATD